MLGKKIASKFISIIDKIRKDLDAVDILLTKSYERTKALPIDHVFRKSLWAEDSPFTTLLAKNTHAAEDAQRILAGKFRVFTLNVDFESKIFSWHKDYYSGKVYPKIPHTKIKIINNKGHDIIVPWELSRLQFIPALIEAHRNSGKQQYVEFFKKIVDNWVLENPCFVGVNWATGMDVALRAINLGLGFIYFYNYLADRRDIYSRVLWSHAGYIYRNDIRRLKKHRNNHFLISTVGLLALSLCFRGDQADKFFRLSTEHLTREILLQFRQDGGNFESAVHYHQLSLEAVLVGLCLISVANRSDSSGDKRYHLPQDAEDRIAKACMLVSDYLKTFHRSPQFGDSSDTRVFIHKDYFKWDPRDHLFLQELATVALPGRRVLSDEIINYVYEESGYGFFVNEAYGICLNASPAGKSGQSGWGHNHCDKGSLVLQVDGIPVLVDSGTYCYTSDIHARFAFKRTKSHNVIMIDGLEQAEICPEIVFGALEGIESRISFQGHRNYPAWTMEHNGYCRCENVGKVSRTVRCLPKKVEITDKLEGTGRHVIDVFWHLHPDITFEIKDKKVHLFLPNKALCRLQVPERFDVHMEKSYYSPEYTRKVVNTVIRFSRRAKLPLTVRYDIIVEGS